MKLSDTLPVPVSTTVSVPAPPALKTLAHAALRQLVAAHHGSRLELARKLGISERSLYRKLKDLS